MIALLLAHENFTEYFRYEMSSIFTTDGCMEVLSLQVLSELDLIYGIKVHL